jgi:hypothetical protein
MMYQCENCQPNSADVDMDIDNLTNAFNHSASIVWKPKQKFVEDIDIICNEICKYETFINLDIYEVLVSCGHNLTWDQDYYISKEDLNWFKNSEEGKLYFLIKIDDNKNINTIEEYNSIISIIEKLKELFELQVE